MATAVFHICWHIECSTLTALSFRFWNHSAGIPSPPLVLFVAMLFKAHFTSHSMSSNSRWVLTPPCLSKSLKTLLFSSSVCSYHLFFISFVSVGSLLFLSFIVPILAWNVLLIYPVFLKRSRVFAILLFSSISLHCSFKKSFSCLLAILWNSAFSWVCLFFSLLSFTSPLSSAICKASSDNPSAFLHFFFFGMILAIASYAVIWTSILSSPGTVFIRSNSLNVFAISTV